MNKKTQTLKNALFLLICIAVIVLAAFGAVTRFSARAETEIDGGMFVDYNEVEYIFSHELVYDTAKAFAPTNKLRDCFDKDHLTAKEFKALLQSLYDNGYVLVSLDSVLSGAPIELPDGKKPLVLSFDDMTYDTTNRGCIDKLVLKDGVLYDYTEHDEIQYTRERENVTILESFIEAHPDFSFAGGRATLCVNGYNGILGYRVTPDCKVSDEQVERDTADCKILVQYLKDLGYTFASHTYYHSYFNSVNAERLVKDCKAWQKYIEPIVGETRVLCYPAGQHKAGTYKNDIFKQYGFDTFLCVGSNAPTETERNDSGARYIYRRPFDGTALRLYGKLYKHLVDTAAIYDNSRFRPFSYKGGYY
ncbi:MAG: polysaccharide deacetylase family protein [Clostridiales bacterium]|nr:polysaccharide deacetylase family protein [Clostridiales bacterium]